MRSSYGTNFSLTLLGESHGPAVGFVLDGLPAGIELDPALSPAEKLKVVQGKMEQGDAGARAIYETIGVYLGYTLAFYAMFYEINHVLLMGRVTSGEGGDLVLAKAQEVLRTEYPQLKMQVNLPDEKSRRVGQSVAAASLPQIG